MQLFIGVVEDILDPLLLGRVRVRIIGIHSEERGVLKTSDLPWAMCLNTSAQISGVGNSGVSYLPGSWVLVTSMDDSIQTIIILGGFPGIPQDIQATYDISANSVEPYAYKTDGDSEPNSNQIPKEQGGSSIVPPVDSKPQAIGPLTTEDIIKLKETIGKHESGGFSNQYEAFNSLGFIGKYQFGGAALVDAGYCIRGTTNKDLKHAEHWTGKNGVASRDLWFQNPSAQESAMDSNLRMNFKTLYNKKLLRNDSDKDHVCGCLMVAHLQGAGGCSQWLTGHYVKADANGTTCEKYYNYGHKSLTGASPKNTKPSVEESLPLTTAKTKSTTGFSDPNSIYPKRSLIQEQDTNRLARGETLSGTVIGIKEAARTKNTRIAGTQTVWDQPKISAAPTYPNNNVSVSKGGIINEIDSTPDNIRIHQYHPSGTFSEVDHVGTTINKIVGDGFLIMERNGNVTIKGNLNVTIEGDCNILAQNNMVAEVYGNMEVIVKNDLNVTSHGQIAMYAQEDFSIKAKSFSVETFDGDINLLSSANIDNKCVLNHTIDATADITHKCTENFVVDSTKAISINSKDIINIITDSAFGVKSKGILSMKSDANINMDGIEIHMQEGLAADLTLITLPSTNSITMKTQIVDAEGNITNKALPATPEAVRIRDMVTPTLLGDRLIRQELIANDVGVLPPAPSRFDGAGRRYESPEDMDSNYHPYMEDLKSKAEYDETEVEPIPSATTLPSKPTKIITDTYEYDNFINEEDIPTGVQISKNYSLLQFLAASDKIRKIEPQLNLTQGQIVQNLQYLSVNVAEKVLAEYPEMIISSGYRYQKGSSISKHYMGMAFDCQFPGKTKSEYYAIAKRITEILPAYDQILLEYKNYGNGNPWIHLSYNKNNNRGMVLTLYNGATAHNGLANLG